MQIITGNIKASFICPDPGFDPTGFDTTPGWYPPIPGDGPADPGLLGAPAGCDPLEGFWISM